MDLILSNLSSDIELGAYVGKLISCSSLIDFREEGVEFFNASGNDGAIFKLLSDEDFVGLDDQSFLNEVVLERQNAKDE